MPKQRNETNPDIAQKIKAPGTKISSTSIIPQSMKTRSPIVLSTWSQDDYLTIMNQYLNISHTDWGAAHASASNRIGFHATDPDLMTTDTWDATLRDALDGVSAHGRIKDWVDSQRHSLLRIFNVQAMLMTNLVGQQTIRTLCPAIAESDATIIWEQDSWDAFLAGLENRKLPIFNFAIEMAKFFSPVWKYGTGHMERSIPDMYMMPFIPLWTLAQAQEARDFMKTELEALIHAQKIELPYKPFSRSLVTPHIIQKGTSLFDFYAERKTVNMSTNVPADTHCHPIGDMTSNMVAAYTDANVFLPLAGQPSDAWAMAPLIALYDAVDNMIGITVNSSLVAASSVDDMHIAFLGTSFTVESLVEEWIARCGLENFPGCLSSVDGHFVFDRSDPGVGVNIKYWLLWPRHNATHHVKSGFSYRTWRAFVHQGLMRWIKGGFQW